MSFAVVLEGMTIAAFAILLIGGKQKREQGWGVLTILVVLSAVVQAIGMALMVSNGSIFQRQRCIGPPLTWIGVSIRER